MSKSKGNVIYPEYLAQNYGVDTIRYYLMREVSFGEDGQFTPDTYITRINTDLANDLGNLVNRTISMTNKYFGGSVKAHNVSNENITWLHDVQTEQLNSLNKNMEKLYFSKALEDLWRLVSATNKFIDLTSPWALAKDETNTQLLEAVMYELLRSIEMISTYLKPFIPSTAAKIESQINIEAVTSFETLTVSRETYNVLASVEPIYPRLDKEVEVEKIRGEMQRGMDAAKAKLAKSELIEFDQFKQVKMKVGKILECEQHPNANKLLKFQIDLGDETRQIISGLAEYYQPSELIGKQVQVVTNLQPVTLRGELSEGMLLTTDTADGKVMLVFMDEHQLGAELL